METHSPSGAPVSGLWPRRLRVLDHDGDGVGHQRFLGPAGGDEKVRARGAPQLLEELETPG